MEEGSQQAGMNVKGRAQVTAVRCNLMPGPRAVGAAAEVRGTALTLDRCTAITEIGAQVHNNAVLNVTDWATMRCDSSDI